MQQVTSLIIKNNKKDIILTEDDICNRLMYVQADGRYIDIVLTYTKYSNVNLSLTKFMGRVEQMNVPHHIDKVDRATVINLSRVTSIAKGEITILGQNKYEKIKIAKCASEELKEKVFKVKNSCNHDFTVFGPKKRCTMPVATGTHNTYEYVDLGLPSGTLWAAKDMRKREPFDIRQHGPGDLISYVPMFRAPYITRACIKGIFNREGDNANGYWGGEWRVPNAEEWKELFCKCTSKWYKDEKGEPICILTGPSGNSIAFYSLVSDRGRCSYWTSEVCSTNTDRPLFLSVELNEPYGDEKWLHFVCDIERGAESNIHAVISADDLKKSTLNEQEADGRGNFFKRRLRKLKLSAPDSI